MIVAYSKDQLDELLQYYPYDVVNVSPNFLTPIEQPNPPLINMNTKIDTLSLAAFEYMDSHNEQYPNCPLNDHDLELAFIAGAKWMKEHFDSKQFGQ